MSNELRWYRCFFKNIFQQTLLSCLRVRSRQAKPSFLTNTAQDTVCATATDSSATWTVRSAAFMFLLSFVKKSEIPTEQTVMMLRRCPNVLILSFRKDRCANVVFLHDFLTRATAASTIGNFEAFEMNRSCCILSCKTILQCLQALKA